MDKKETTNLFSFATKELSQDAYLMWIISNYNSNDNDLADVSRNFIKFLLGEKIDFNNVKEIKVLPQDYYIDISVHIIMIDETIKSIYIEDKVYSSEHNQLDSYNKSIKNKLSEKYGENAKKIFYKTGFAYGNEEEKVRKNEWEYYNINMINEFWNKYLNHSNVIVSMYSKYVNEIYNDRSNINKPTEHNIIKWSSYFEKIINELENDKYDLRIFNWRNAYVYICIKSKGYFGYDVPYMEIRSRDCLKNRFIARIMLCDLDDSILEESIDGLKEKIKELEHEKKFECYKSGKKEIAKSFENESISSMESVEEFKKNIDLLARQFLDITNDWMNIYGIKIKEQKDQENKK